MMKQNTKFIWIYGVMLLSISLILILFAGLTQNNYREEIEQHQTESAGIRQSLSALSNENKTLYAKIQELEAQNQNLKNDNQKLLAEKEAAVVAYGGDVDITRILLEAYSLNLGGQTDLAKETIKPVNPLGLTSAQKYIYDTIIGE